MVAAINLRFEASRFKGLLADFGWLSRSGRPVLDDLTVT